MRQKQLPLSPNLMLCEGQIASQMVFIGKAKALMTLYFRPAVMSPLSQKVSAERLSASRIKMQQRSAQIASTEFQWVRHEIGVYKMVVY